MLEKSEPLMGCLCWDINTKEAHVMNTTTLKKTFLDLFDRDELLRQARATGEVERLRNIHPLDFAVSITSCALGDETISIASARRHFGGMTGYMPEESSFHDRFNEGSAALMEHLFLRALVKASPSERGAIAKALGDTGILDLWAIDTRKSRCPEAQPMPFPPRTKTRKASKSRRCRAFCFSLSSASRLTTR